MYYKNKSSPYLLYSNYYDTLTGKIHPTDHDSTAIIYLHTVYSWIQNLTVCLNSYGVSVQKYAYYEQNNKHVLFMEKILLINFGLFILLTNVVRQYQFGK